MQLIVQRSQVHAVHTSTTTRLVEGRLEVNLEALRVLLETDTRLQRVRLDLARPGEACRIGRVCDVIAPCTKLEGGEDFPGGLLKMHRIPRDVVVDHAGAELQVDALTGGLSGHEDLGGVTKLTFGVEPAARHIAITNLHATVDLGDGQAPGTQPAARKSNESLCSVKI